MPNYCSFRRLIAILAISSLILQSNSYAQLTDSTSKKLRINGFCLCQTALSDLKKIDNNLQEVSVEEMDLPPNCYGQDSRFIAGKGYAIAGQSGMIFQKDQASDFISKIRLTKQFAGKLPDGTFIDLSKFLLKDLIKLYPNLKDTWGSRGCSTYWNFSNGAVSFYLKIDSTKKPQFPIDEAYYMDKPIVAVDITLSCYGVEKEDANSHAIEMPEINNDPVFFIDSVKVNKADLMRYNPNDIATVTVYKDTNAIKKTGVEAKYGLIYIETKKFDIARYQRYFSSKSFEYAKLISAAKDSQIQYILNKRPLDTNYEGDLAAVNDKIFKGVRIINKQQLLSEFGITGKSYGVIISSDIPSNLYKGKDKF
ncbi:hypothetical protein [Mucilaginibacter sp. NFX135]|uniref:hypothetical protein n=1 Tax=Mucilaginibacter sp. NFX135 TaxID=3402687 RepID=UPI003AFA6F10